MALEDLDEEAIARMLEMADKEEVNEVDATGVKQLLLLLERKINRNQMMRVKFPDQPGRFVDSEVRVIFYLPPRFVAGVKIEGRLGIVGRGLCLTGSARLCCVGGVFMTDFRSKKTAVDRGDEEMCHALKVAGCCFRESREPGVWRPISSAVRDGDCWTAVVVGYRVGDVCWRGAHTRVAPPCFVPCAAHLGRWSWTRRSRASLSSPLRRSFTPLWWMPEQSPHFLGC